MTRVWDSLQRRPFLAALLLVLVGVGAVALTPAVGQWWQDHQDAKAEAVYVKRLAPAIKLLDRLSPPGDTKPCSGQPERAVVGMGFLCLRGNGAVLATTTDLVSNLASIGAQEVHPSCVRATRLGVLCEISAQVAGQRFNVFLGPQVQSTLPSQPFGVHVSGGVGLGSVVPGLPQHAPKVVVPTRG
jgi:hypothetical protein